MSETLNETVNETLNETVSETVSEIANDLGNSDSMNILQTDSETDEVTFSGFTLEQSRKLRSLVEQVSEREGCRLYDLELSAPGGRRTLRVYVAKDANAPVKAALEDEITERVDLDSSDLGEEDVLEIPSNPGGIQSVTIEQCANISRGLGLLLDVEDIVPGTAYDLEVSSPGLERHLRADWHFKASVGQKIRVRLKEALNLDVKNPKTRMKSVEGILKSFEDGNLAIEERGDTFLVPRNSVGKANVVFEFGSKSKGKR